MELWKHQISHQIKPYVLVPFLHFLLTFSSLAPEPTQAETEKLLVVLLDGFRWDYLDQQLLPGFGHILGTGVRAAYALPVFPSLSYPNYYSIMTGLYPENHGIMLNYMYNPDDNETFGISAAPYWWEQAEPVWITATKKGLRADMYFWPGCEVPIKSLKPKSCIKHIQKFSTMAFSKHMATAIEKLAKNESDIALVFCEQPDLFGHIFGPDSFAVKLMVRQLDLTFQDFLHDIETFNMREKVNVIIVSDHGMANVKTRVVLVNYINMDDILKTVDEGAVIGIYPKDGKLDKVFSDLTKVPNVRVWKKKDIPEEFHIKNNIRTPPIIVLANPGYSIQNVISAGHHGYDTKDSVDMRGIFLAFGPKFKTGVNIPPIKNQDVYNLIMKLCGLEPLPNNGTWDNIAMSLRTP